MTRPNLIMQISALAPARRSAVVLLLLALGFILGLVFAAAQAGEHALAWWWPAAGVGAAAALSATRRYLPLVIIVAALLTGTASLVAGRPPMVIAAGVIGTAAEIAIMCAGVSRRDGAPRLASTRDVGRFLATATAAAAVIALLLALATATTGGDALARFVGTAASHLSALLLIVPLVLIDRSSQRVSSLWQTIVLTVAIVVVVVLTFGPEQVAPLAFLPVPLLAWAAFSQTMFVAMGQVLLAVSLSAGLTVLGRGPFADQAGLLSSGALLQTYAVVIGATCLIISTQRAERQILEDRQDALLRLLRDAFARSRTGFAVVQLSDAGALSVIEANGVAGDLLTPQLVLADGVWRIGDEAAFARILRAADDTARMHESAELGAEMSPARLWIDPITRPELGRVLLVTVEDLRPVRAVERAMTEQLDRERHVSEALRELTHKQDAFVASISHELRTPITSIVGYAQVLEEELTDEEQRAYLEVITRNAERLSGLVENALRAGTDGQQPVGAHGEAVIDLARVVENCLTDLRYLIDDRELVIEEDLAGPIPVRADTAELGQIVSNLLTNAIKFSPRGARVHIAAATVGSDAVLEISDAGPGIAEADRERVFERFYRSPQAVSDGVPGTGIGLSVSQGLAAAMGGAISLSQSTTGGTLASLRLPVAEGPVTAR